jgi:hypothetical protein
MLGAELPQKGPHVAVGRQPGIASTWDKWLSPFPLHDLDPQCQEPEEAVTAIA